jgi:hypothetical protein
VAQNSRVGLIAEDAPPNPPILNVVTEEDVFRLAIRGFAVIEDLSAAGIADAFDGSIPSELKRLPFPARLALFGAVTDFTKDNLKPVVALAKLRNDFAHGRLDDLTKQRADKLADEFR